MPRSLKLLLLLPFFPSPHWRWGYRKVWQLCQHPQTLSPFTFKRLSPNKSFVQRIYSQSLLLRWQWRKYSGMPLPHPEGWEASSPWWSMRAAGKLLPHMHPPVCPGFSSSNPQIPGVISQTPTHRASHSLDSHQSTQRFSFCWQEYEGLSDPLQHNVWGQVTE